MSFATDLNLVGTRAAQPAAAATNNGKFYMVTDEGNILERSNGSSWVAVGGGGGDSNEWVPAGTGNTATGVWDQAVDGSAASANFIGMSAFKEVMVAVLAVTAAASGFRQIRVSTNNGSSYLSTSGDYISHEDSGLTTNRTGLSVHSTGTAAARSGIMIFRNFNQTTIKTFEGLNKYTSYAAGYIPTTTALDALQVLSVSSSGNLTGGVIRVFGR